MKPTNENANTQFGLIEDATSGAHTDAHRDFGDGENDETKNAATAE